MADLTFDVAKRRAKPITFTLGGESMLIHPATEAVGVEGDENYQAAEPEVRGPDDHEYVFTPPKSAFMVLAIIDDETDGGALRGTFDWMGAGLSEEDNDRIIGRLRDSKDDLDIDTLTDIVRNLNEAIAGRPTT